MMTATTRTTPSLNGFLLLSNIADFQTGSLHLLVSELTQAKYASVQLNPSFGGVLLAVSSVVSLRCPVQWSKGPRAHKTQLEFESREVWEPNYNRKSDDCEGGEFPVNIAEDLNTHQQQNVEVRFCKETNYSVQIMLKVLDRGSTTIFTFLQRLRLP